MAIDVIVVDGSTGGINTNVIKVITQTSETSDATVNAAANKGYILTSATLQTVNMPASPSLGDVFALHGKGAGLFRVVQRAGEQIVLGNKQTAVGVTGYIESTNSGDAIYLICDDPAGLWRSDDGYLGSFLVDGIFNVAIGPGAGNANQGNFSTAIGFGAGATSQGASAIAIGQDTGSLGQGINAVAIGNDSALSNQGTASVSIGLTSGESNQGNNSVAIGNSAGKTSQSINAVSLGHQSGENGQGESSVSIGYQSGENGQGENSVSMGSQSGKTGQGDNSVAVGNNAGRLNQSFEAVAIGFDAGDTSQGSGSVSVGLLSGNFNQGANSVSMGSQSGQADQGASAIAIGNNSANDQQGVQAVAVGNSAGRSIQGLAAIAMGSGAGETSQGTKSVAIGDSAANDLQGINAVAVGSLAGRDEQGANAVAIGYGAAEDTQGAGAIAIGNAAASSSSSINSISIGNGCVGPTVAGRLSFGANMEAITSLGSVEATQTGYINKEWNGVHVRVPAFPATMTNPVVTAVTVDTFENKTFDANATGNILSNVEVADLANGTDGELITWDAAGAPAKVAVGTAGQLLTSNGAGAAPNFKDAAGGGAVSEYGILKMVANAWAGRFFSLTDTYQELDPSSAVYFTQLTTNFTNSSNATLKYTGAETKDFFITASCGLTTNNDFAIAIALNGSVILDSETYLKVANVCSTTPFKISLALNDEIAIYAKRDTSGGKLFTEFSYSIIST